MFASLFYKYGKGEVDQRGIYRGEYINRRLTVRPEFTNPFKIHSLGLEFLFAGHKTSTKLALYLYIGPLLSFMNKMRLYWYITW